MPLEIINPSNAQQIQEIKSDTIQSVATKFKAARQALPSWAQSPFAKRADAIRLFRAKLLEQKERLSHTLSQEMGKPIQQARGEIEATLQRIDYFLSAAAELIADEVVWQDEALQEVIRYEPLGVVVNISAWNYPYFVGGNVFIPALLSGNAVLYKPSEYASLTGLAIGELMHASGVPPEIFQTVIGRGKVGQFLLDQKPDGVFFTGSYSTGQKIARSTPRECLLQMELGGKDPSYVTEDVDIAISAASLADGAFYNTGQSCCSVERIYVHASIFQPFVDAFVKAVQGFTIGPPQDESTYIGPLAREPQLEILAEQVADALKKGAQLLCGGKRIADSQGYYYEPTVLTNVNHTMLIMREESFGPLIGIQSVRDDEEATALMNDTSYGLTAGVYCRDQKRAENILGQVQSGSAYWNCCDRVSPRLPWSGRRNSGVGTTLSHHGIRCFSRARGWHLKK